MTTQQLLTATDITVVGMEEASSRGCYAGATYVTLSVKARRTTHYIRLVVWDGGLCDSESPGGCASLSRQLRRKIEWLSDAFENWDAVVDVARAATRIADAVRPGRLVSLCSRYDRDRGAITALHAKIGHGPVRPVQTDVYVRATSDFDVVEDLVCQLAAEAKQVVRNDYDVWARR